MDGSKWQPAPFDVQIIQYWLRGDAISNDKSSDSNFPFILRNVTLDKVSKATQISPPAPSGQRRPDSPSYFTGSHPVINVTPDGTRISLKNASRWKIAPDDYFRVANWKLKDRVRVENNGQMLYGFTLKNLDSGEYARADQDK